MRRPQLLLLLLTITLSLSSCSTTRTLATWEREGLAPKQYSKLIVYVSASTLATRSTIERTLAKQFTKKKLEAVAASDRIPDLLIDTFFMSTIQSSLASQNADLFLFINLGGITLTKVTQHTDFSKGGNVGTGMGTSGSYLKTLTRIENRLYDAVKGTLLMSVDTESDAGPNDNIEDVSEDLAAELISQFRKKAIFFPK